MCIGLYLLQVSFYLYLSDNAWGSGGLPQNRLTFQFYGIILMLLDASDSWLFRHLNMQHIHRLFDRSPCGIHNVKDIVAFPTAYLTSP